MPTLEEGQSIANSYAVVGGRKVQAAQGRVVVVRRHAKALESATETTTHLGPNRSKKEGEKRKPPPLQPPNGAFACLRK